VNDRIDLSVVATNSSSKRAVYAALVSNLLVAASKAVDARTPPARSPT
jgi:hypothetical protein